MFIAFGGHDQMAAGSRYFINTYLANHITDPAKGAIGEEIVGGIELDLTSFSNVLLFNYYVTAFYGFPKWVTGIQKMASLDLYLRSVLNDLNTQKPMNRTYECLMQTTNDDMANNNPSSQFAKAYSWKATPSDTNHFVTFAIGTVEIPQAVLFQFTTSYDSKQYYRTPYDTFDRVRLYNIQNQLELVYSFFFKMLSENQEYIEKVLFAQWWPHDSYKNFWDITGLAGSWNDEKSW
jgi:hypothetical protein